MRCRWMRRMSGGRTPVGLWVVVVGLLTATEVPAQEAGELDRVARFVEAGDTEEARQLLARWEAEWGGNAEMPELARAWYLAGRLSEDARQAELYYLRVVIEGSSTPYADDALLHLAQYQVALGDFGRALEYLQRLRRDYPHSEHAAAATLWWARAARLAGDSTGACAAIESGLAEVGPADTTTSRALRELRMGCVPGTGSYSVQVAALKDRAAAQELVARLRGSGYDAWLFSGSGDQLHRVRVGRQLDIVEAQARAERLVASGYSPFLVSESPSSRGGEE